jgi:hypothetical protein
MVMTEAGLVPAPNAKIERPTEQYIRELVAKEEEEVRKDEEVTREIEVGGPAGEAGRRPGRRRK